MLVYDRIESNRRKTFLVMVLFVAATLLFVVYVALWATALVVWCTTESKSPAGEELVTFKLLAAALAALAALPVLAYLGYCSSSKMVLRIAGARRVGPNQERELRRTVENLSIGAGLRMPGLYVVESPEPNAFATGLDPEHASLVVTRGLLRLLEPNELEGVIAHEFSHIGNHDTRLNMIAAALVITLRLPFTFLRWIGNAAIRKLHSASPEDQVRVLGVAVLGLFYAPIILAAAVAMPAIFWADFAALGPLMAILPLHVFVLAPLLALRVSYAVSRDREFLADADAVLLARNPEGLARALAKIGAATRPAYVHPAVALLYIADPTGAGRRSSRTHPSIDERIARLSELGQVPPAALAAAAEAGARYGQSALQTPPSPPPCADDGVLAAFTGSYQTTRVFRVAEPAPLFQAPDTGSRVLLQLPPSALIVVFEHKGDFWEAVNADRVFGYVPDCVCLEQIEMEPEEVLAHLPPPPPRQPSDDKLSDSQKAIIALLALGFFVASFWILLDLGWR